MCRRIMNNSKITKEETSLEKNQIFCVKNYFPDSKNLVLGTISVLKGQIYFVMGVNLDRNMFYITNKPHLPFCREATVGYAPIEMFSWRNKLSIIMLKDSPNDEAPKIVVLPCQIGYARWVGESHPTG